MKATRDEKHSETLHPQRDAPERSLSSQESAWRAAGIEISWMALELTNSLSAASHHLSDVTGLQSHTPREVLILKVNRPHVRNALDLKAMRAFAEVADCLSGFKPPAAVILTGAGSSFVAGGDLKALHGKQSVVIAQEMSRLMCRALSTLRALSCPFIVAAEGHAVGGGAELLLAGDLRVVSEDIRVRFAQVSLGLCTGWGGSERLADLMGRQRALALMLDGAVIDAKSCLHLGIASRVAPAGGALQSALAWATQLAQVPQAVAAVKQVLRVDAQTDSNQDQDRVSSSADILEREQTVFPQLWVGDEHWSAVERIWSKRKASSSLQQNDQKTQDDKPPTRASKTSLGMFIVLEGIDGAGTTTQAERLISWLNSQGRRAHFTCEPSDGTIGRMIRGALSGQLLGHGDALLPAESLALLFAADRADHWHNEIEPLLRQGVDVVCDRYLYSSLAYQGLELEEAWVESLNSRFARPDLLLFVKVSPEVASARRDTRGQASDRYEVNELQREIAKRYERICEANGAHFIDGERSLDNVSAACYAAVETLRSHRVDQSSSSSDEDPR